MATLIPNLKYKPTDSNDQVVPGGKLYSYYAGTTNPRATYSDSAGLVANTNPVILDAEGEAEIWLRPGSYKFILTNADDEEIYTIDDVRPADGGGGGIVDEDYVASGYSLEFEREVDVVGLQNILDDIYRWGYRAPSLSLAASGSGTREKGNAVTASTLTATIGRRGNDIDEVRFYLNPSTLLNTQTSGGGIPSGGNSTYNWTGSFADTTTFRVEVDDVSVESKPSASATATFTYLFAWYGGVGAPGLNGAAIAALSKTVASPSAAQRVDYTLTVGEVPYFAYPTSIAALAQITDENGFDATSSFTYHSSVSITNIYGEATTYRVYERNTPAGVNNSTFYTFRR